MVRDIAWVVAFASTSLSSKIARNIRVIRSARLDRRRIAASRSAAATAKRETLQRTSIGHQISQVTAVGVALLLTACTAGCGSATHHQPPLTGEEFRVVDLIERLPSRASAIALAKRLGTGPQFARRAMRETVPRADTEENTASFNGGLVRAIFAAPINKPTEPVLYVGKWVTFVVRSVNKE